MQSQEQKEETKQDWQKKFAEKCQQDDYHENPKQAWSMVFKLMEGFQRHHKTLLPKAFNNHRGKISKDPKEN
jgi:hypothetical protein